MRLGLGNTLVEGGGPSNPDGLALDLQFAADKSLTARKGPTPVFTRGSTATFVGSNGLIQSAAINDARFDHNPVTLACRGLLIEESRTNLILQSENIASATWVKAGGSISSVANVEPDGSANSELFSEDGTTGAHRIFQAFVGTIGTVYTLSVFLKFNGRAEVALENRSIGTNPLAVFNIQNGTIGSVGSGLTAAIQAYPNGWYQCSITGTATLAGGNYIINGYSGSATYTGLNGPAFYVYGAQVEAGAFATSYIPTTTAALARSADVCSITGTDFSGFYNASQGTFILSGDCPNIFGPGLIGIGTGNGAISRGVGIATARTEWWNNSANLVTANSVNWVNSVKVAAAYDSGNRAICLAGGAVATSATLLPNGGKMEIGRNFNNTGNNLNGHLAAIRYYKKRLANAKLQALTV